MCTVSIVPHDNRVRMRCNRDERRSPTRAQAPGAHNVNGGRAVFPVDPEGGGTWIGVNDAGVTAALLSRAQVDVPAIVMRDEAVVSGNPRVRP